MSSCLCDDAIVTFDYSCGHCVNATGRPGTLSNITIIENNKLTKNWKTLDQIQRQIQHTVRITPSEYTMNLATTTTDLSMCSAIGTWLSDRSTPHGLSTITHTRNGSSTKRSRTALRPGVSSAPTTVKGVDVKHFSYQRYLNKIKGLDYAIQEKRPPPIYGAKNIAFKICA